jgi:hypothetical protein
MEKTSPLGEKDEDLRVEEIELEVLHEDTRVAHVVLPLQQRAQPGELLLEVVELTAFFVAPVRGDAELAGAVHLQRANLHFERITARAHDRCVQRLVHVGLGHRDVIFETPGQRLPKRMDDAQGAVAIFHRIDDDAHGREIVDRREVASFAHLGVDRVKVFRAAGDVGFDAELLELAAQLLDHAGDGSFTLGALLCDALGDVAIGVGVEIA